MLAAENGALPQGKVGGMGDVTRDLPRALAALGHPVTVVTPAYGRFAQLPGAKSLGALEVPFATATERVGWYRVKDEGGVAHEVLDHPRFAPRGDGAIYHDDGADTPFFTDATKFAFFSAAAAALVAALPEPPAAVHLHDWHLGCYLALRGFDHRFGRLRAIRTVFTIHNLALQGTRPLSVTSSSLGAWYPWLRYRRAEVVDPVYADCFNPVATAVRLADMVNTVSPTYALEVQRPNDDERGFRGGEHLDHLLTRAQSERRLVGILNGCDYSAPAPRRSGWKALLELIRSELAGLMASESTLASAHYIADRRLDSFGSKRPRTLLTSIGRVVDQKVRLFREPVASGTTALERILDALAPEDHMIMLGSGDPEYERFFTQAATRHANFLFLRGYSDAIATALYATGDLFLMPSSFEPCGISQMLAMRAGQPCVVHAVGGLRDTVDRRSGFPFEGDTPQRQAQSFAREVAAAVGLRQADPVQWQTITAAACAHRFDWRVSADRYVEEVYAFGGA